MNLTDVERMRKGGLYLTVLHPSTLVTMHVSRHRTFEVSGDLELLRVMKGVQAGRILVLAAMGSFVLSLARSIIAFLSSLII